MTDNVALLRRVLLLVVLFAPLGFALLCAVTRGTARRLAAGLAVYHLVATAALVALCVEDLRQRGEAVADGRTRVADKFQPIAVPGDLSTLADLDG